MERLNFKMSHLRQTFEFTAKFAGFQRSFNVHLSTQKKLQYHEAPDNLI